MGSRKSDDCIEPVQVVDVWRAVCLTEKVVEGQRGEYFHAVCVRDISRGPVEIENHDLGIGIVNNHFGAWSLFAS